MRTLIRVGVILLLGACNQMEELPQPQIVQEESTICFYDPGIFPEYPGGNKELLKFINTNLIKPKSCIEGRVIVEFIVDQEGQVSQVRVVRGITDEADKEAMRVVKMLPTFLPGKLNGQPVRTKMILPIRFNI